MPSAAVVYAGHLVIEHGLVERHRDRLRSLEADRRVALLLVLDARQLHHADDDLLVRHADPHVAGQPGGGGKALEVLPQRLRIGHLAVSHQPLGQVLARAARHATAVDLRGRQVAAIDIETDAATLRSLSEGKRHGGSPRLSAAGRSPLSPDSAQFRKVVS